MIVVVLALQFFQEFDPTFELAFLSLPLLSSRVLILTFLILAFNLIPCSSSDLDLALDSEQALRASLAQLVSFPHFPQSFLALFIASMVAPLIMELLSLFQQERLSLPQHPLPAHSLQPAAVRELALPPPVSPSMLFPAPSLLFHWASTILSKPFSHLLMH